MASPFSACVVSSMRTLYPECLADKSFDNTGLLLEAPFYPERRNRNSVLLTIDLTKAVAEEAIANKHSVVVAYHPIIFRGLKSITLNDSQQSTLLRLAAHGISVYSPHTAVDIVPGGMGDWLADVVTGKLDPPTPETQTADNASPASETDRSTSASETSPPTKPNSSSASLNQDPTTPKPKRPRVTHRTYSKPTYPRPTPVFHSAVISHSRSVITPSPSPALDTANSTSPSNTKPYATTNTGSGRYLTFSQPQPLTLLITRIAHAIGLPKGFPVAIPQQSTVESLQISTVGICPGSGASVISRADPPPDLVFTGEMSHHEALAVTERGGCVVTLFHSNSERGYLWGPMRERLEEELSRQWVRVRAEGLKDEKGEEGIGEVLADESVEVVVSERDRDPYGIVVLEDSDVQGVTLGFEEEDEDPR
jgi:dinuclear metal center YbgI/SA1388 family protein